LMVDPPDDCLSDSDISIVACALAPSGTAIRNGDRGAFPAEITCTTGPLAASASGTDAIGLTSATSRPSASVDLATVHRIHTSCRRTASDAAIRLDWGRRPWG